MPQPPALRKYWANKNKTKHISTANTCRFGCTTHEKLVNGMCPNCYKHHDARRYD